MHNLVSVLVFAVSMRGTIPGTHSSKMIMSESFVTIFVSSIKFRCSWGNSENWLELKIELAIKQI
jgi:hypothetical protein